jgi:transposase-like protein
MISLFNLVRESVAVELPQVKCENLPDRVCPDCGSGHLIKNGSIHNAKPKHQCKSCGYQFVDDPTKTTASLERKQLIDRLLLERISLRGIARVTQVSWSWLQDYVNQRLAHIPRPIEVSSKSPGRVTIECDALVVLC